MYLPADDPLPKKLTQLLHKAAKEDISPQDLGATTYNAGAEIEKPCKESVPPSVLAAQTPETPTFK